MEKQSPRIGVYLRVSTLDQSTEIQKNEIESYLRARNWTNAVFFEDKATGSNTNRPAFQELFKRARARDIDVVICYKIDRFGRSLKDLVTHIHELTELGIPFISLRDQIDLSTSQGRLMANILGSLSEFERELIVSRCRAGLQNAKAKGIRLGRPPKVDIERAALLRSQNWSLKRIAEELKVSKSAVHKSLSEAEFKKRSSIENSEIKK